MKKNISGILFGILAGAAAAGKIIELRSKKSNDQAKKMEQYYHILTRWLELRQEDRTLYSYFKKMGYSKVGIYGMRELGQRLYYELKDSDIEMFLMDRACESISFEYDITSPVDGIPCVDVIIVTAAYYYDSIRKELEQKVKCPIVSIADVLSAV